jgi:hypothetical protein
MRARVDTMFIRIRVVSYCATSASSSSVSDTDHPTPFLLVRCAM